MNKPGKVIKDVKVHHNVEQHIQENIKSEAEGRGGMASKLKIAKWAASKNIPTYIANGNRQDVILVIVAGKNVELIHGEIYTMSPIGSRYAAIVANLTRICNTLCDQIIVWPQNPIHIDQWNEPEPDLAILNYRKDRYSKAHPEPGDLLAVIEVSDTTYAMDKNVKLPLYASTGIPHFWIVNLFNDCIEAYSDPKSDQYRNLTLYFPDDEIALLGNTFDLSDILLFS